MVISAKSIKLKKKRVYFQQPELLLDKWNMMLKQNHGSKLLQKFINQKASLTIFNLLMGLKKIIYCYITK